MADVNPQGGEGSTARRDELLAIQEDRQKLWAQEKVFEVDAPAEDAADATAERYSANFPYPYMNGVLHLGHAFSLSKVEFATAYHRLCGKRSLFPQGFHCTGMPIKAAADKLVFEMEQYGNPPIFPDAAAADAPEDGEAEATAPQESDPTKFSGKKSKAAAKQGTAATQWGILQSSGIPETEIPNFRDPTHWLYYFPPLCQRDMSLMGCGVDWRRSFVTTDVNPYYDSFVRWQFNTLRAQGRVTKAKRFSVYSPKDGQPCADHDRASGEGGKPQNYTLVKMQAQQLPGKLGELQGQGPVYLMAATLRPETMAGQTNCWVLPEGDYGAYRALNGEIFVLTPRAARNLAFQDKVPTPGQPELLLSLKGQDLIGVPLSAPSSPFDKVYVLPLLTILMNKGTGVVTSVPSDSPDDFAAFTDLKKKPKLREKFGVKDEWIMPYEVVPIISIPGFGDTAAEKVCADLKISSQNDTKKLAEAKQMVYLKGFTDGVMLVGKYKGEKVCDSKDKYRADLLESGAGIVYSEPDKLVISRSGDECVVALTDQWYLDYGEPGWLEEVKKGLEGMELYSEETRNQFTSVLEWLHEWACSRSFGLGTRVPWDPAYLIESLSDSTIYMAYYTVAHILQNGDIYGQKGGKISAEDMSDEVWDYIFLGKELSGSSAIPQETLKAMRREFDYWYPFDMRTSGKDLIQNHLTFCLYNHVAIWHDQPQRWPRSIRCNGHLQLDNNKMSKSLGNFLTLNQGLKRFGADAVRMAMADAGDAIDDANFQSPVANSAILRITKELAWIQEVLQALPSLRTGKKLFADKVFANDISKAAHETREAFDKMLIRDALKHGCYELQKARDAWRLACGPQGMDADLVQQYIEVSTLLLTPICPHVCDHVWRNVLKKPSSALTAGWPQTDAPDAGLMRQVAYVEKQKDRLASLIGKETQVKKQKKGQGPADPIKIKSVELHIAKTYGSWQATVLEHLQASFQPATRTFSPDALGAPLVERVKSAGTAGDVADKALKGLCIPFARAKYDEAVLSGAEYLSTELPFDEASLIEENQEYLTRTLNLESITTQPATGEVAGAPKGHSRPEPGNPAVVLIRQ